MNKNKYPTWMRLYMKIDLGESLFHSGFFYGVLAFAIINSLVIKGSLLTNLGFLIGYVITDQILYRLFNRKHNQD